jgi:hypothetical protein
MSLRFKEAWRARAARKARINQRLADADQEQRQAWVDRTRIPEQPQRFDLIAEPGEWEGLA